MDSGCTHLLLTDDDTDAPCYTPDAVHSPILVRFPNGTTAGSVHSGTLTANGMVFPVWVMRKCDIRDTLIAHAPLTALGCTIMYNDQRAYVNTPSGSPAICGYKAPGATSWRVNIRDINPHGEPFSMLQSAADDGHDWVANANVVQRFESVQQRVNFTTALLGNAPKETVMRALRLNWVPWAPCTQAQYAAYAVDEFATHAGHMRELRHSQHSTKLPLPVPPVAVPAAADPTPPGWWTPTAADEHADDEIKTLPANFMVLRPIPQAVHETLFADSKYKKRPSSRGDTHELVFSYNNYTHVERCKGGLATSVADAYQRGLDYFDANADAALRIDFVRIDNATSGTLQQAIAQRKRASTGQPLQLSYVAVGMHRANRAEKAIQDFESAELATFATAAFDFPRDYWPELLAQVEIVHNHLKPWRLDPSISAWEGFHGRRYDFDAHPMTVAGARVYTQIDKIHRNPDLPYKAKPGWYLGPAPRHHRCARILAPVKGEDALHIYEGEQQFAVSLPEEFRTPRIGVDEELAAVLTATHAGIRRFLRGPALPDRARRLMPIAQEILRAQDNARLLFPEVDHGDGEEHPPAPPAGQRVADPPNPVHRQQRIAAPGGQRVWDEPPLAPHRLALYERLAQQADPDPEHAPNPEPAPVPHPQHALPPPLPPQHAPPPMAPQQPAPPAPPPLRRSGRSTAGQHRGRAAATTAADDGATSAESSGSDTDGQPFGRAAARRAKKLAADRRNIAAFDAELVAAYAVVGVTMTHAPPPTGHAAAARKTDRSVRPSSPYTANGYNGPKAVAFTVPDIARLALAAHLAQIDAAIDAAREPSWSDQLFDADGAPTADACRALNLTTDGKKLTYARAMREPDAANWQTANDVEFHKLIKDTQTMEAIHRADIPRDRLKDVCYYSPQVKEKMKSTGRQQRVRGTYGGNLLHYPGRKSAKTAELEVVKLLLNKVVSEDGRIACLDITDFYLSEPMERPEFLRIPTKLFSAAVLDDLDLRRFIDGDAIFFKVKRTMYGLPQAGYLAQQGLIKHLNSHGYVEDPVVPMLFTHESRNISFTLVVDDFCVAYHDSADLDHLVAALRSRYKLTVDLDGSKYLGMTIAHDRAKRELRISMPGYVAKMLEQFGATDVKLRRTPRRYVAVEFGKRGPQQVRRDIAEPVSAQDKQRLQAIVGAALYLARTVDPTILEAVGALSAEQSAPTTATMRAATRLLGYLRRYPDSGITYRASDMQLRVVSDASYNSRPQGRSVAGGIMYVGGSATELNGALVAVSTLIDVVVASAYEAELAAVFTNMQRAEWLRTILGALGYPQGTTQLVTDNAVAVAFANDTCKQTRSKSVDLRFHWVRDRCRQRHFDVAFVKGTSNAADNQTKALPRKTFHEWRPRLVS